MSIEQRGEVKLIKEFHESTGRFIFSLRGPHVWIMASDPCPLAVRRDYLHKLNLRIHNLTTRVATVGEMRVIQDEIAQTESEIADL